MHIQGAWITHPLGSPDLIQQRLACHRVTRMAHQELQQVEFPLPELKKTTSAPHLTSGDVQDKVPHDETITPQGTLAALQVAAPQHSPYASHEFAEAEGLDDIVIRTYFQAHDAIQLLTTRGEHEDRHGRVTTQRAAQREAVHLGEHDIQENEVWLRTPRQRKPLWTRAGMEGLKPFLVQAKEQGLGNALVILDEQHLDARSRHWHRDLSRGVRGFASGARGRSRHTAVMERLLRAAL
jgi:hypothetical protein